MQYRHELVRFDEGLNAKIFVHSVLDVIAHWHHEIELLMVLQGSVEIRRENQISVLQQDDVFLINRNELHSIKATEDDNILLAIQFSPDLMAVSYPELKTISFECSSVGYQKSDQVNFDLLRRHLANIIWAFSKKQPWFKITVETELLALISTLLKAFPYQILEDNRHHIRERELERLTRIVNFIGANYSSRIQLQHIATKECVTVYHLSRFFKERMGISFQEYLFDYRIYQAAKQIINSNDKISDIAFECGFNDPKLFYKKFKLKYNQTPVELRKRRSASGKIQNNEKASYMSVSHTDIYKPLFEYLTDDPKPIVIASPVVSGAAVKINPDKITGTIQHTWRKLTTFGCSYEGLKTTHQAQLTTMQQDLGFEYIRFQGIFAEQMQIVFAPGQYNWTNIDELIDFLLSLNLKPFFCLGYMPEILASGSETVAHWRGNITPPQQMTDWTQLVAAFFSHIIERYGISNVKKWYFEVWNEPDLEGVFWAGTQEDYHQLYKATFETVRAIAPEVKIGGPSVSHMTLDQSDWLTNFVDYCQINRLQPDFFSYHIYPEFYEHLESLEMSHLASRQTLGPDGCLELINQMIPFQNRLNSKEHHVTEWNFTACWGNKVLDTAYLGSFVAYNAITLYDKVDSLGIWTFSDLFEERGPSPSTFHGGFGMMTREGIKKPNYHVLTMLNRLGTELLLRDKHYIVTRSKHGIQILMVNYIHFDPLYASGDVSAIDLVDPYSAFNDASDKQFEFLLDLNEGEYKTTRYQLNREHGSAYDNWKKMGAPNPLSEEDITELKRTAYPKRITETLHHEEGALLIRSSVPEHGVELILIQEKYLAPLE